MVSNWWSRDPFGPHLIISSVSHFRPICTFVPAGCVCDCHISIRDAVDPDDQRGDAARSVRRHQVLPLPGHLQTLRPSGTLGSSLIVSSLNRCIGRVLLAGMFCFSTITIITVDILAGRFYGSVMLSS